MWQVVLGVSGPRVVPVRALQGQSRGRAPGDVWACFGKGLAVAVLEGVALGSSLKVWSLPWLVY